MCHQQLVDEATNQYRYVKYTFRKVHFIDIDHFMQLSKSTDTNVVSLMKLLTVNNLHSLEKVYCQNCFLHNVSEVGSNPVFR